MSRILVSGALYLGIVALGVASGQNCGEDKVRKCISIAEPMLKDPHLIFPDNMKDINNVCRTWSNFVDCIRRYIDKCFSKVRKDQFNSAVEPPIASVHQMCSVSSYQAEYLQYAGCIKSTVIEPSHCGGHYTVLVSEVSQENVRKPYLCCAYHNFRSCVIRKTQLRCDNNQPEGIAAKFSRQVLDKAFRFLQDQCLNYIPDPTKCIAMLAQGTSSGGNKSSSTMSISRLGEGRSVEPTASSSTSRLGSHRSGKANSDIYSTAAQANTARSSTVYEAAARAPSYATNVDAGRTSISSQQQQMPVTSGGGRASSLGTQQRQTSKTGKVNDELFGPDEGASRKTPEPTHYTASIVENSVPIYPVTQRSANYGRGISWSAPVAPSTSAIPDWATNTWLTYTQDFTTEEIYPAAGSFGGNNIDEPNQQGLSRNNGRSNVVCSAVLLYSIVLRAIALLTNREYLICTAFTM
ncbi:uncharacterized protein LOC106641221 [Copidosoma floridanum]|uniref:uncharacterized protein LOC106641221 n=1 Tax=Copidosoma floridanum TaxID=29053 RepID=UPI0006C99F8D|nr:uncharacterized protein LOC106641221 [Copidosoma floridanum]